jgi:hypothetical protein
MMFGWTARSLRVALVLLPYVAIAVLTSGWLHDRAAAQANTLTIAQPAMVTHMCGVYRAVVISANDPLRKSRVHIKVPQANVSGLWASPSALGAPLPAVGSQVWVMFESGMSDRPVWFGSPPPGN